MRKWLSYIVPNALAVIVASWVFSLFGKTAEALAGFGLAAVISIGEIMYRPASRCGELDPSGFVRPDRPARRHL